MKYQQIQIIEVYRLEPGDHVTEVIPSARFPHDYDFDRTEWLTLVDVWRKEDEMTLLIREQHGNRPPEPIPADEFQFVIVGRSELS